MKEKIIRIILSPFILLYGYFMLAAGTALAFPFVFIVMLSLIGFISQPFVYLFRLGGTNLEGIESFIDAENPIRGHFLGMTIHIWLSYYIVYEYIKTGKILTGE